MSLDRDLKRLAAAMTDEEYARTMTELKASKMPVTMGVLMRAIDVVADGMKAAVQPLREELDALKLEREKSASMRFHGVHQRALDYPRGAAVTHGGALWLAVRDVSAGEQPGTADAWQLAVKAGEAK